MNDTPRTDVLKTRWLRHELDSPDSPNGVDALFAEYEKLERELTAERKAREEPMHASAPMGYKCSECQIDSEPCPVCYRTWWAKKHSNTNLVCVDDSEVFAANQRAEAADLLGAALQKEVDRMKEALTTIVAHVTGDKHPKWTSDDAVYISRSYIADTAQAALKEDK